MAPIARVLLLIPTASYRAPDFMAAARTLGVEVVVGSDHRSTLADLAPGRTLSLETEAIPAALAHGAVIGVSECEGPFYDIGTPGGYRSFCDAVKAGMI